MTPGELAPSSQRPTRRCGCTTPTGRSIEEVAAGGECSWVKMQSQVKQPNLGGLIEDLMELVEALLEPVARREALRAIQRET